MEILGPPIAGKPQRLSGAGHIGVLHLTIGEDKIQYRSVVDHQLHLPRQLLIVLRGNAQPGLAEVSRNRHDMRAEVFLPALKAAHIVFDALQQRLGRGPAAMAIDRHIWPLADQFLHQVGS